MKLFICHASEDKSVIARPLAEKLRNHGLEVWYDEYSLKVGDSLRREIERGLKECAFGIVILSPNFFAKEWPQRELDALTARETAERINLILPVWHQIDKRDVFKYSPILADKIAVETANGIDFVVKKIWDVVKPTLVVSPKQHLIDGNYAESLHTLEMAKLDYEEADIDAIKSYQALRKDQRIKKLKEVGNIYCGMSYDILRINQALGFFDQVAKVENEPTVLAFLDAQRKQAIVEWNKLDEELRQDNP